MRQRIRVTRHRLFKTTLWKTRLIFWGGAVLVGVVAAIFALLGDKADHVFRDVFVQNQWLSLVITPAGLMLIVWLTRKFFPGAEGSGIPQTLIAIEGRGGKALAEQLLSFRIAVGKVLLTVMGLFSGASIGREGPTVHLGAAIMYALGSYVHLPARYLERGLIMTGGGAGIAAAFNTPLAGIVFAIEEMARSFDRRNSSMILIGVILAGMTAIYVHQDNYNYYGTSPVGLDFSWVWLGVVVCGVTGGLLGGLFSSVLIHGSRLLRPYTQRHYLLIAGACGLVIAVIGILSGGDAFGTGYIEARQIVSCTGSDSCTVETGMMYPVYKILATVASYLSGIPGGIFAPSLASGAGLGSDLASLFPPELASTIVILGMVGYFSGVVQTPITAFVIVMEMTDNQDLVLALMATSLIASGASKLVCKKPIYYALAENFMAALKLAQKDEAKKKEIVFPEDPGTRA
ncbi:MAG: chloride channel protein [Gammaproteobacteria bacterium]|nr:chloride channel protein [Gammaproteobacteria bacterium]